jgi:MFS family permease
MRTGLNAGRPSATVAAAVCALVGMSALFVGSFSIMLPAVTQDLHIGVATFSLAFTVVQYVTAAGAPFAGRLIDKVGPQVPAGVGIAILALGVVILSQTDGKDALIWIGPILIGIGAAVGGPIAYVPVVSSWYGASRALALAVVLSISPQVGQALVAPFVRWMIETYDWRVAYLVIAGIMVAFGAVPAAFLLKTRPRRQGTESTSSDLPTPGGVSPAEAGGRQPGPEDGLRSRQVYASRLFWMLTAADCMAIAAIIGIQTHLVSWLGGERAISPDITTALVSAIAIAGIVSVVAWGFLADHVLSSRILVLFYSCAPVGITLLILSGGNFAGLIIGVVLLGCGLSAVTMLLPYLVTRFFGMRATAEVYGVSLALNVLAIGTGPLLISWLYESTGSYALPTWIAAGATLVSLVLIAGMGPYRYAVVPKKVDEDAAHLSPSPSLP